MVTRSASAAGFVAGEHPRVAIAADGTLAAIVEPLRVVVLELPGCAERAEIGVDLDAAESGVAWVGRRLAVLARYAAHSTVHLVEPCGASGPRPLAEIRLEAPMTLYAAVGAYALAVGAPGAVVLAAGESQLTPYRFPSRAVPVAAGAAGAHFVVALAGAIEEWDPHARAPRRRFKLARAAAITAVGGSERVVWMTTQADPARLDVFTYVNRGQPKVHELPEPIAHVAAHPRSDLVVCLGAETRSLYVVDLDGRTPMRAIEPTGIDRADSSGLVVGSVLGVLAAQARRPVSMAVLERRGVPISGAPPAEPARMSDAPEPDDAAADPDPIPAARPDPMMDAAVVATSAPAPSLRRVTTLVAPAPRAIAPPEPVAPPEAAAPRVPMSASLAAKLAAARAAPAPGAVHAPEPIGTASSTRRSTPSDRPAAPAVAAPSVAAPSVAAPSSPPRWAAAAARPLAPAPVSRAMPTMVVVAPGAPAMSRMLGSRPGAPPHAAPPSGTAAMDPGRPPEPTPSPRAAAASWRDDVHAWARAVRAGATNRVPAATPIDVVLARFDLPAALAPALALSYGAHLAGELGAAPVDIARGLGGAWDEALGRGRLAAAGVAVYAGSRVRLAPAVQRVLDELPPETGVLAGTPGPISLLGPCVVVAPPGELAALAEHCAPLAGGAVLAVRPDAEPGAADFEARAYGAVPIRSATAALAASPEPRILIAADEASATALGLPRLG